MAIDPQRIQAIFLLAVEATDAAARAAVLERACGADLELRQRVEALLVAHAGTGSFSGEVSLGLQATIDAPPLEGPGSRIGHYKLLQEIGRGGMGVVFLAEQQEPVQRKVALKIIKPGMDTQQVIARFEAERQALALMDHPNMAKVLDGGATASGRPYFVMELVKGVPITAFCDERRLTPRERFELFVPVCQAVQHAHQKGIIHRDLKPSNVMVCLYDGKPVPKIIDFGVAKATGQKLTEKTLFTGIGAVVGTLEYMSPEQAELNQLDIDTRSDIYALGVLLYELLTGTTPLPRTQLRAAALLESLRIIREEEPPKPSLRLSTTQELAAIAAKRSLEPKKLTGLVRGDLDWIVMKCLEKERNRRYETANGLASDVRRYLADEPVLAGRPSSLYRLRKFVRRHKTRLAATASVVLVLLLTAVGLSWTWWERSERQAETERTVRLALDKTKQLRDQAAAMQSATSQQAAAAAAVWHQAEDTLGQAAAALSTGLAGDELHHEMERMRAVVQDCKRQADARYVHVRRKEQVLTDLDEARMASAVVIDKDTHFARCAKRYAEAFAHYGLVVADGETQELARRIAAEQDVIREALIAALDYWCVVARLSESTPTAQELLRLAQAADSDAWRKRYRAAVAARDGATLRTLSAEVRQRPVPAANLQLLAHALNVGGARDEGLALLRWGRAHFPTDFWLHFELGNALRDAPHRPPLETEEAIGCFRAALALRPTSSVVYDYLGEALADKQMPDEAIAALQKAVEIDGGRARTHGNLGRAWIAKGQMDEAIAALRRAVALDPKYARAYHNLGEALRRKGRLDDALAAFRKATVLEPGLAESHNSLGAALYDRAQVDEAISEYRLAVKLDAKNAMAYSNLGNALHTKRQVDEAIAVCRKAIALDPKLPLAYINLGTALTTKRQLDEAVAVCRKAIALDPSSSGAHRSLGGALFAQRALDEALTAFRKAIALNPNDALAHNNLGAVLLAKDQYEEALPELLKALELKPTHALAHNNMGNVMRRKGRVEDAIAHYRKCIELDPHYAGAYTNLGNALQDKGQWDDAIAEHRKAVAIGPAGAINHNNLGFALYVKRDLDGAIAACQKAVALDPTFGKPHATLGDALQERNQLDAAIAEYRKAIALGIDTAHIHNSLGAALNIKGQFDGAIAEFRRAIALDGRSARQHSNLGVALAGKKKWDEAIAAHHRAIALDSNDAVAHYNLGIALKATGRFGDAGAEFRKSIALDPQSALAHCNLGMLLCDEGQFAAAVAAFRSGHDLAPGQSSLRANAAAWLKNAERMQEMDRKLPAVLAGKATPTDTAERLDLALLCLGRSKQLYAAGADFFATAFNEDGRLADDMKRQHRYNAACAAALAGCGQGKDADRLDERARATWRQQARQWLRADLAYWSSRAGGANAGDLAQVRQTLLHWQSDSDLAGMRDADAVAWLPTEERKACQRLWAEVAVLLQKAGAAK